MPPFIDPSLPFQFGGIDDDLAGLPVCGEAFNAPTPGHEVVPEAQGQPQRRHREAELVDLRPGDGPQPGAVGARRAAKQGGDTHAPPRAGAVGEYRHAAQQLEPLGGEPSRAAKTGADPYAPEAGQVLLQLGLHHPTNPSVAAHHRHADHRTNRLHARHVPSAQIRHRLLSARGGGFTRGNSFRSRFSVIYIWNNRCIYRDYMLQYY
ncbi:MAG: hypothetical protein IJH86_10225 [Clostridia bacterium]|nr:hypothetical protein [Clostridia bacterium]